MSSRATTVHVPRDSDAKVDAKGDTKGDAKEELKGDGKTETASPASPAPGAEKSAAAKMPTRKMYYLSCLACRWTSRDVGLPDQTMGMNVIFILLEDFAATFPLKCFIVYNFSGWKLARNRICECDTVFEAHGILS